MSILDVFRVAAIKREEERLRQENQSLQSLIDEIGAREALVVKAKIAELKDVVKGLEDEQASRRNQLQELESELAAKRAEIIVVDEELLLESFALYKPKFSFTSSEEYKSRLDSCRELQKTMIKSGSAVTANEGWTVNGSASEGRKMVSDMKKLVLRSFNNECDYCVDNVKFNNIEAQEKRIDKSFEALNKLGRIMNARISSEYLYLKHQELELAFEYQKVKQEEKEAQRQAREELREQQKLEQEIRQARERLAKDRKHYAKAVSDLELKLSDATSEEERITIDAKLAEVRAQFASLEDEERAIDYREKNAKAGYVYIISNIGSFGEGVYKIGMTRRLEPLDRISELGDASVPFAFDVHSLIFSENAPALEASLHAHFEAGRLNKINPRKEFFRGDIYEIERVIRENYDKAVDVVKEAPAEQYRESLMRAKAPLEL